MVLVVGTSANDGPNDPEKTMIGSNGQDTIDGLSGNDWIQTLGGNDTLIGSQGNDALWSGTGADTMIGGTGTDGDDEFGRDTYHVDNAGDVIIEYAGEGTDRVHAYITYNMATNAVNVENLRLVGFSTGLNATGNALNNTLEGNREKNTLIGGTGNDSYIIYNETDAAKKDVIIENAGEGSDTWIVNFSYILEPPSFNVENITLTGNKLINATGNIVDNTLTGNSAKNTLTGLAGNDTYVIQDLTDVIKENAGEGNDTVVIKDVTYSIAAQLNLENISLTGTASVNATGNTGSNVLIGNTGSNTLDGLGGADVMIGFKGNDVYIVDNLGDTVGDGGGTDAGGIDEVRASVSYTLVVDLENITLTGGANINGTGNDLLNTLTGNIGLNTLTGGLGDDYYYVQNTGDVISEQAGEGTERAFTTVNFNMDTNADQVEILTLLGTLGINGTGNGLDNTITGNSGVNVIFGRGGEDTIYGNAGNDVIHGEAQTDTLFGDAGNDTMFGGDGDDFTIAGGVGNDILNGGNGNDGLKGGTGTDTFLGGLGDDSFEVTDLNEKITEFIGEGSDTVVTNLKSFTLAPVTATQELENLALYGSAIVGIGNEIGNFIGGAGGSNTLMGMAGNDIIAEDIPGAAGNDTLDGGTGVDILRGGIGNDVYFVDNAADQVTEGVQEGTDAIYSSALSYDMSLVAVGEIEYLYLVGGAERGTGNDEKNTLVGNAGVDTLAGGLENDGFIVNDMADIIVEYAGEGFDTIYSSVSYTMAAFTASYHVEGLTLIGTDAINGTGNTNDNFLTGNTGINTLRGGLGNDGYFVDDLDDMNDDTFIENIGEGTDDFIFGRISVTLKTATSTYDIENIVLSDEDENVPDYNINASGNALDNTLTGNRGNNTLNGSTGVDYLVGNKGNDTYFLDNIADFLTENAGEGNDTVNTNFTYSLTTNVDEVENLTLYGGLAINGQGNDQINIIIGNIAANTLDGLEGNDTLDGGGDADVLIGGDGNDLYIVDNSADIISEVAGEGRDTVRNSASFSMLTQAPGDLEIMIMTGAQNINGTGNTLGNTMTGNTGNNTIDGGVGTDTLLGLAGDDYLIGGDAMDTMDGGIGIDAMAGNLGDDVYIVTSATKTIIEAFGEGIDEVRSTLTHTLAANVENLTLEGSAPVNGFGNNLGNFIKGNAAANTLDGATGVDTMEGGSGNDTFIVDDAADTVNESGGGGTADTIRASVTYDMGVSATGEVENLTLTGAADIDGYGNSEHNTITGNAGINTMDGATGNDFYVIQTLSDVLDDQVGEGEDTVLAAITWALDNIHETENIFLLGTNAINATGNDLGNSLIGNSGKNILDGGLGDDTYGLGTSSTNDVIVLDTGGNDTVIVGASYTIASRADLENIWLTGTGLFNATGNANVNSLVGNDGKNTLNGGAGADFMVGGRGDDTFFVDNVGDITVDDLDRPDVDPLVLQDPDILPGGKDTVISSVSYALSLYLDNLTLTNVATALNGTGNALTNIIKGNSFNNVLNGGFGSDTLDGGAGNDSYYIDAAGDVIKDTSGIDHVFSSLGFYTLGTGLENLTLIGPNPVNGTGNIGNNTITGNGENNIIDGAGGSDTMIGGGSDTLVGDIYFVDKITDVVIGDAGLDTIRSKVTYSLDTATAVAVENLFLEGTLAINATGNALDNSLVGNSGVNTLVGGDGNDFLSGGGGKDVMYGGNGADTFYFQGSTAFSAVDTIMDFELGLDAIFFDALIDPLLQVSEDFLEFRTVSGSTNLQVWLDYDGQGEAYVPQLIAVLINPS
jgi:Ca2+-binding RTX toxin-like protein